MVSDSSYFKIPGLPGIWGKIKHRYNRFALLRTCPACGSPGAEAGDWFTCSDAKCRCVAVVRTGEAFVPCRDIPSTAEPLS